MNILILEDNPNRIEIFLLALSKDNVITIAETAQEAIDLIALMSFDVIFLDHDLGLQQYVSEDLENTGSGVVRWMLEKKEYLLDPHGPLIIVHSQNEPAAKSMESKLQSADFNVRRVSFYSLCKNNFNEVPNTR